MQREAALAIDEEQLEALAASSLRLPHTDSFLLPTPVSREQAAGRRELLLKLCRACGVGGRLRYAGCGAQPARQCALSMRCSVLLRYHRCMHRCSSSMCSSYAKGPTSAARVCLQVRCAGGCCEEWYCSSSCADAAWQQYHQLLCPGPEEEEAEQEQGEGKGKGKAAAAGPAEGEQGGASGHELQQLREALREFLHLADSTNDVFRLAAIVVARVLLAAQQQLQLQAEQAGSTAGDSSSSRSGSDEPSSVACWAALLAAWQPFAVGHKGLWWECTAAPPEAAADMRQLAEDSLELLCAALPAHLLRCFPALLTLPVWGSIIGE